MTVTHGKFEWDSEKDESNVRKHKLSFAEAVDVFDDPFLYEIYDEAHSSDEDRFTAIGRTKNQIVVLVISTQRGEKQRLLSARYATKHERGLYYERIRRNYF